MDKKEVKAIKDELSRLTSIDSLQRLRLLEKYNEVLSILLIKNTEKDKLETKISQIQEIDSSDFIFPTSEPRIGLTYLEHPIKNNTFIPMDLYNQYILEEKQSELIEILKNLGVSKITILVAREEKEQEIQKIYEYIIKNEIININKKESIWEFDNTIVDISQFDDKKYTWLNVEPEWEGTVKMLKAGGVKRGEISFSTNLSTVFLTEFDEIIKGGNFLRLQLYSLVIEV
jgi:hypothetical protein